MFRFDIERWVPQFILRDKNGYALARAIEAAAQLMNDTIRQAVSSAFDYEHMPEWRLDELAWETNCLYDYSADIETKRRWIKNSVPMYRLYGTPAAIYQYLSGYFDDIDLEEYWQYNGEPFHFRVTVEGEWNPENEAWARHAIEVAKNVRSVLDSMRIGTRCRIAITAVGNVAGRFSYPFTGPGRLAGLWPEINTLGIPDDSGKTAVQAETGIHRFPYPMAGTQPQINTLGTLDEPRAGLSSEGTEHLFDYPNTSEEARAGTRPGINTLGIPDDSGKVAAQGEAAAWPLPYPMAGTRPEINTLGLPGETDIHAAQADETYNTIYYKLCGEDEI